MKNNGNGGETCVTTLKDQTLTRRDATLGMIIMSAGLVGCGGSGSSSGGGPPVVIAPVAPPPPPPSPPPPPPPPPASIATEIGLRQAGPFATLAWAQEYSSTGNGNNIQGKTMPDLADAMEFAYIPASSEYEMQAPGVPRARLIPEFDAREFTSMKLPWIDDAAMGVELYKPGSQNKEFPLAFTSLGFWHGSRVSRVDPTRYLSAVGDFVYGISIPTGALPLSGSALYDGIAYGGGLGWITGTVRIEIDYGNSTGTGSFTPRLNDGIGGVATSDTATISSLPLNASRSGFSGAFSGANSANSAVEVLFTGPQAEELMGRWKGNFFNPHTGETGLIWGIWVAKRQ